MTSSLLEESGTRTATDTISSQRLRATMAAMRFSTTWFGVRKSLTAEQKSEAADTFGAEGSFLSAGKKLIDTRHPKFKTVTSIRGKAFQFWKAQSLPYPEPGIRLVRQDDIAAINTQMTSYRAELADAVDAHCPVLDLFANPTAVERRLAVPA